MPSDLEEMIFRFAIAFSVTFLALVWLLVWRFPLSPISWKRSDYLYFSFAIIAAVIAFANQTSGQLRSELLQYQMQRKDLFDRIRSSLDSYDEECRIKAAHEARRLQRERDRAHGVLSPSDETDVPYGDRPTDATCKYVKDALSYGTPISKEKSVIVRRFSRIPHDLRRRASAG